MDTTAATASTTSGEPPVGPPQGLRRAVQRLEGDPTIDGAAARLRELSQRLTTGRWRDVLQGRPIGHALHPALTDLPLGCFTAANLLDVVGGRAARPAARRLIALGLLAVPPTVATGMAEYATIDDERSQRTGAWHAIGNTAVALLYLLSWNARRRDRFLVGKLLALAGGLLAVATGYLGGHLSFARLMGTGDRGLDEPAPVVPERSPDGGLSAAVP